MKKSAPHLRPLPARRLTRTGFTVTPIDRACARDIVLVVRGRYRQAFYRSSGRNSGRPGAWLPFDGIAWLVDPPKAWFDKLRFTTLPLTNSLCRFGSEKHRTVSEDLLALELPRLPRRAASRINRSLKYRQAASVLTQCGGLAVVNRLIDRRA